jgi:hypothetical protein
LEVLCYLGLLKFPEQLDPALALLTEVQRVEALNVLSGMKDLPRAELLKRWGELRLKEYLALSREADQRNAIGIDRLPPSLREQWVAWLVSRNG